MSNSSAVSVGRILISNDDGLDAIGIAILEEVAAKFSDDVWVIAPTSNRSGMSRAITLHNDVIIEPRGNNRFACSGTPSDCVIMGMAKVLDRKPDLVLSGINAGMNVADDVLYSGTIAAAMEASLMGVPAIALSQRNGRNSRDDFAAAAPWCGPVPQLPRGLLVVPLRERLALRRRVALCVRRRPDLEAG